MTGLGLAIKTLNPDQREVARLFGRDLHYIVPNPAGLLDLQRRGNTIVRLAGIESIDNCILDLAGLAIHVHAAARFRKRMDAVEYLSAPAPRKFVYFLPEQPERHFVCAHHLPLIAVQQQDGRVDRLKYRAAVGRGRHLIDACLANPESDAAGWCMAN